MLGLYGTDITAANLFRLSAPFIGQHQLDKLADLRPAYHAFLRTVQPEFPVNTSGHHLVRDRGMITQLLSSFTESKLNDLSQERMVGSLYNNDLLDRNIALAKRSFSKLGELNPALAEIYDLAVHSTVLCGSEKNADGARAHGGTTNKCIGLIWLNLNPSVSEINIIEMMIHELTHTLVFIDELNSPHFNYETLTKKEYWALSSILKRDRPMDKVVHSIVVSFEIMHARKTYLPTTKEPLFHPPSESLKVSTLASIDSVLSHPLLEDVCMPRAIQLVKDVKEKIANY